MYGIVRLVYKDVCVFIYFFWNKICKIYNIVMFIFYFSDMELLRFIDNLLL